jgi:hypothetical protein
MSRLKDTVEFVAALGSLAAARTVEWATGKGELRERLELAERERDKALGLAGYWKGHAAACRAERDNLRMEQMYRHDSDQRALSLLDRALAKGLSSVHDEAHELLVQAGRRTR